MRHLGVDLGATNIKAALLDGEHVVWQGSDRTRSEEGPDAVMLRMAALGREAGATESVGVAVPGLFDDDGAGLLFPNLHGDWVGRPIARPLADAFGRSVRLVNDGHAFALAEARLGAGRGARNVMCVVCGTGIGGGLVLDGALHLGVRERAGEFGHHTVREDGPACSCGNRGCLELYAGARAIAAAAGRTSFDDVAEAARGGDERVRRVLARAGELIGLAIANIVIFVCPDRVVIGGGVAAAGELLLGPIRTEVARRARVAPLDAIEIVPSALGPIAGAVGAALFSAACHTSELGR